MNAGTVTRTRVVTVEDLKSQGFTPEQIARLVRLRDFFDNATWVFECLDSMMEFRRIQFLKWRYEHGKVRG